MYSVIAQYVLMTSCMWMTSHTVLPITKFKTYDAATEDITGQEVTVRVRSRIHCIIECRTYPHCISAAYATKDSLCYLHPQKTTKSTDNDQLQNNGTKRLLVYYDNDPDCSESSHHVSYELVTTRRSLWSVEGNVTCNDDYYPPLVPVTCLSDGSWTPSSPRCQKRVWRHPETVSIGPPFPIPGTVIVGWSLCVEGIPTHNTRFVIEIYNGSNSSIPIHTSWRLADGNLVVNDMINGSWKKQVFVSTPPLSLMVGKPFYFRMTVNTSSTIDIYMDNKFFYRRGLRFLPSSFSHIGIRDDVNTTKVESWCRG